jgi:hypothetical protein
MRAAQFDWWPDSPSIRAGELHEFPDDEAQVSGPMVVPIAHRADYTVGECQNAALDRLDLFRRICSCPGAYRRKLAKRAKNGKLIYSQASEHQIPARNGCRAAGLSFFRSFSKNCTSCNIARAALAI